MGSCLSVRIFEVFKWTETSGGDLNFELILHPEVNRE